MRAPSFFVLVISIVLGACGGRASGPRTYTLQGQVLSVDVDRQMATIKHEDIPGFMAAMTMPYKVQDTARLTALKPGDLINATLIVVPNDAYLSAVKKVGEAPLEQVVEPTRATSSGVELLKPGDPVPAPAFVDQNGARRTLGSFKGHAVVLTFMYTRCPIPTFCPLMDRQFADIQQAIKADANLMGTRLLSVSFDPASDTPAVLKKHAEELKADPATWTFLTGEREGIEHFASQFGLFVTRPTTDPADITHNLRTVLIDADGRLVKLYTGNEWTTKQVLADLKTIARAS